MQGFFWEFDFAVKYMAVAAVGITIADFIVIVFALFFRNDSVYGNGRFKLLSKITVLAIDAALLCGVFYLFTTPSPSPVIAFSILTGVAMFTIMLAWSLVQMSSVSSLSMEVLETVVGVIEAGDENLDGHSLHVQNLTMLMYDYLPVDIRKNINPMNMQYAALLLDLGKHGIPREIIDKKGKLTPQEKKLIQSHPEICEKLLEGIPSFNTVAKWIKYHHERVDGGGYYKLKGKEIPIASRILAVADTYSAITMERSYRASLSHEEAVAELKIVAGRQLDSKLVDIFCSIPTHKVIACMADVKARMKRYEVGSFR